MSIDQVQSRSRSLFWSRLLKPSHRTRPEQFVGLGIYLLICFGFQAFNGSATPFFETLYFLSLGLSMWTLWRRYSLRILKLELSVFLAQFLFQGTWSLSYFALQQILLALVALLLLWCNTLLATLLFWKKEPLSGGLLLFPLVWIFYLAGLNMVTCISNP